MPSDYDDLTEDDLFLRDRQNATARKVLARLRESAEQPNEVILTGIDIPFWHLVMILVKVAFAAVPAFFVILFVLLLINIIFGVSLATFFG